MDEPKVGENYYRHTDRDGDTPLHWAACKESPAAVALLLDLGADTLYFLRFFRQQIPGAFHNFDDFFNFFDFFNTRVRVRRV